MPAPDPRTGNICVWFISCLFFIAIISGGVFLIIYISVPETESTAWYPVAGVVLVAIPWLFWLLTLLYRCISRAAFSGGSGGGGAGGGANDRPTAMATVGATSSSPQVDSPGGVAQQVHFETAIVVDEQQSGRGDDDHHHSHDRTLASSSVSSRSSHESELPLTLSKSS